MAKDRDGFDLEAATLKDLQEHGQVPATHSEVQGLIRACYSCTHVLCGEVECEAFPDGIPEEVLQCRNRHLEPIPGGHGLRYQFDPELGFPKPKWAP